MPSAGRDKNLPLRLLGVLPKRSWINRKLRRGGYPLGSGGIESSAPLRCQLTVSTKTSGDGTMVIEASSP